MVNGSGDRKSSNLGEELPKQRIRRQSTCMIDYVSGDGLSKEEDVTNFVMFPAND